MVDHLASTSIVDAKAIAERCREPQVNSWRHATECADPATGVITAGEKVPAGEVRRQQLQGIYRRSSKRSSMTRPQFFGVILAGLTFDVQNHRLLRRLPRFGLLVALCSLVGLFDMRMRYATILSPSLWVRVIHEDEFEHLIHFVAVQFSTMAILCSNWRR